MDTMPGTIVVSLKNAAVTSGMYTSSIIQPSSTIIQPLNPSTLQLLSFLYLLILNILQHLRGDFAQRVVGAFCITRTAVDDI